MRHAGAMVVVLLGVLAASPRHARAQEPEGAGQGARCGARADCADGLRCMKNVCVDDATFVRWLADVRPADLHAFTASPETSDEGTRFFFGGALGAVAPAYWSAAGGNVGAGVQFALRFGALVDGHFQLQLEVSPASTAIFGLKAQYAGSSPAGLLDAVGTVGYLIPMNDFASWILRIGGGGGAVFGAGGPAQGFAEFRADVLGVAIRTSQHSLLEFNVPSFRVMSVFPPANPSPPAYYSSNGGLMMIWVTNVGYSYLF